MNILDSPTIGQHPPTGGSSVKKPDPVPADETFKIMTELEILKHRIRELELALTSTERKLNRHMDCGGK